MRRTKACAGAVAFAVALGLLIAPAEAEIAPTNEPAETVTAKPLPTWQTNGPVYDIKIVNGVTYVGGNFTTVRPPGAARGTGEVARNRIAAFNAATGDLLDWAPSLTSPVVSGPNTDSGCATLPNTTYECAAVFGITATPDNRHLIVGGDFKFVDGKARGGVVAFDLADAAGNPVAGTLDTTFKPVVNDRVFAVAATNTEVYLGGAFTAVDSASRTGLAAVAMANGAVRGSFAPLVTLGTASYRPKGVTSMALSPDASRLIVGGGFNSINGDGGHPRLNAVFTSNGSNAPWASNRIHSTAWVTSLSIYGDTVYSTADAVASPSEGVIAFDVNTGRDIWYDSCRGASHSMAMVRGVVYAGSHAHDCTAMDGAWREQYLGHSKAERRRYTLRAEVPNGRGGARVLHWFPRTDDANGAFAMATDDTRLWIGGEFTSVDNANQQGLTRFTFRADGGPNRAPTAPPAPVVTATRPGVVDVAWRQAEDPDHANLEYWVFRNGGSTPVYKIKANAKPWLQGWLRYEDTDIAPGQTHSYTVRAVDPLGTRGTMSAASSTTVPTIASTVANVAVADKAYAQYSFQALASGRYPSGVGARGMYPGGGVAPADGNGFTGKAVSLAGGAGAAMFDATNEQGTRAFTVETMFRTTTTSGGSLMSMTNNGNPNNLSTINTGHLYMDNAGRINFGIHVMAPRTDPWAGPDMVKMAVGTTGSFNDGTWHHVVATIEPTTGSRIYIDGELQASDPSLNWTMLDLFSQNPSFVLRAGGDQTAGYPNAPASPWFNGEIDEVAAYRYPLSAQQVARHADLFLGRLSPPSVVQVGSPTSGSLTITWATVPGATGYTVHRDGTPVSTGSGTSFTDTGLTPRTTYTYTVAALADTATGRPSPPVTGTTAGPDPVQLLTTGSTWKYDTSGAPAPDWTAPGYDDTAWPSGPSQLGYGEGDEATALTPFMPDGTTRRITTYLRTDFTVADAGRINALLTKMKRDDGVVIYLNGQEVTRDLMPAGTIGPDTLATTWAPDDGQTWITTTIPATGLVDGRNVLAVEIHQNVRSSLDLTWDMQMNATF